MVLEMEKLRIMLFDRHSETSLQRSRKATSGNSDDSGNQALCQRWSYKYGPNWRRLPGEASLRALIDVLDICLDLEDAVAGIGVGAEEFGRALSLAE